MAGNTAWADTVPELLRDGWLHPAVRVAPSDIAGIGLFATEPIPAGAVVACVGDHAIHIGNHSCDPNLGWSDAVTLVAMHDIGAGEELTNDYATSTADPAFLLRCHCESTRCRGMIEGDDWQIPELQRRYAGYWVPTLHRRIHETPVE